MPITYTLGADQYWPLWGDESSPDGAFELDLPGDTLANAVVTKVDRPFLFGYKPKNANGRAVLILGGGGYVQLMVGREGIAIAKWLNDLGFYAFVLVHRFPNAETGAQAPLDDARRAVKLIVESGLAPEGFGICGLSSGGHLGAALLAEYPQIWSSPDQNLPEDAHFAILGYGPISTNAMGRQIVANKPPLPPAEKQELYDIVQPDVQLRTSPPPTFIVYSNNDPVVPVVNAYRLAEGITKSGGSVELHIFADAPHGFALDTPSLPVSNWPSMCEAWMKQHGWVK